MLAVQRPSMGSSKPGDLDMPFGYSFDSSSNFPFPSPPSAAPGPSLLDDNESKFLDSFFDGVSSENFDYNLFTNGPDAAESAFGWDELPPTFMGTTSSFGQQPHLSAHDQPEVNFDGLPPIPHTNPPPPPPQTTSAEVLAAATVLQNGVSGRSQSFAASSLIRPDMSLRQVNGHIRPQSISQYPPARPYTAQHEPPSNDYMRDSFYTDMVFGHPDNTPARLRNSNQKIDIRWGSDSSFNTPQGFMAHNNHDAVNELERAQLHCIDSAFRIEHDTLSAENSVPPSPVVALQAPKKTETNGDLVENVSPRPKKRRKSKVPDDKGEEALPAPKVPEPKKRKAVKKEKEADVEPVNKRRKSTANATTGKAARENLTEDQKRENHIRSEQKRRTLIREGFEDLGELVPGLRGGGFSKSAVLIMAADWLEDLLQGNELLKERLEQMEGR
ncbi:hypothetical protein HYFRA_00012679 [Hymenoscyphus fraxineus]|uniref:BHLH domain-containing protein n=1 Tax=Hymenoscyphus fraxineus TaxID=746836 RepID=A0A9N9PZQ4_9HELO|nr:hypothetical protein HYFRA_00012679 [Hymenoscyphus fraxineus]